jgi:hypothetical protein
MTLHRSACRRCDDLRHLVGGDVAEDQTLSDCRARTLLLFPLSELMPRLGRGHQNDRDRATAAHWPLSTPTAALRLDQAPIVMAPWRNGCDDSAN